MPEALRAQDYENRWDLRHLPFVTIDGISARDFDDAVFAEKRGANYCLYVAIADVSHYVKLGRPLDEEAHLRRHFRLFP
ncbi:Ribonuclease R [Suttonella indologenes]|uniref:Ribonuclease R n=1 Tax=Suttonella indologenes TaxID=13276 RepID=A0A380MLL3_9GAMM|nr:Ribonuclease R [Suttonella indologenes]